MALVHLGTGDSFEAEQKATRAMYPVSSSTATNANIKKISGTKLSTPPTPAITPSATRSQ